MSALQKGPYEINLNVNTRQRLSFSFPELQYSLLQFNSRKQLLTFDELKELERAR